nr:TnsD family Tn7-like transposition protein [Cupriavidus numazuensis]
MTLAPPKPYPDELLYSVIARYVSYLHPISRTALMKMLTGRSGLAVTDLPRYLNHTSAATFDIWALSGTELAQQLTLFPFFSWPLSDSRKNKYLERMLSNESTSVHSGLKAISSVAHPVYLRICLECYAKEIREYGEAYWHRTHQLPGLLICPIHDTALHNTSAYYHNHSTYVWNDATDVKINITSISQEFTEIEFMQATAISKLLSGMLTGELQPPNIPFGEYYLFRAFELGLSTSTNFFPLQRVSEVFFDFYSENLLTAMGISSSRSINLEYIWQRLGTARQTHPLYHALLRFLFDTIEHRNSIASQNFDVLYHCINESCRNPDHGTARVISARRKASTVVMTAKCSCGFVFDFSDVSSHDRFKPENPVIKIFSQSWINDIRSLRDEGYSIEQLSEYFSISPLVIERIIYQSSPLHLAIDERRLEDLKNEWERTLAAAGNSVTKARLNNSYLFETLNLHARDWLISFNRRPKNVSGRTFLRARATPFTHERDIEWSTRINISVQEEEIEPTIRNWISCGTLAIRAGLRLEEILAHCDLLPLTIKSLEMGVEHLNAIYNSNE